MYSSSRLTDLEETLKLWYEHLGAAEKALPMAMSPKESTAIEQDIRVRILPAIRKHEKQYWNVLVEEAPSCEVAEADASYAIVEVVQEVELIKSQPNKYSDELMQKLQKILDTLNEQERPAANKLIAALPIIPGIMSYQLEIDTEISLKRVFEGIKQLLTNAIKKNHN